MSLLQSEFIDNYESNDQQDPFLNHYNPIIQNQEKIDNMYELLLQNDQDLSSTENSINSSLNYNYNYNYKNYNSTLSNSSSSSISHENLNAAPIHTINPKQLNPLRNKSISETIDFNISLNDDDPLSQPKPQSNQSNWSMNDEFKNAIATWINQNEHEFENEKETNQQKNKSSSISFNSNPKFHKTSITKRRKSDSIVNRSTISLESPKKSKSPSSSSPSHSHSASTASIPEISEQSSQSSSLSSQPLPDSEEEKPFKCEGCPKAFRRSEHLKRHFRSVHSNIRPFPCKFCEKKFSRSDNLAQHLRTHQRH